MTKKYSRDTHNDEIYFTIGSIHLNSYHTGYEVTFYKSDRPFIITTQENFRIYFLSNDGTCHKNRYEVLKGSSSSIVNNLPWFSQFLDIKKGVEDLYDGLFNYFKNWAREEGFKEYSIVKGWPYSVRHNYKGILLTEKNYINSTPIPITDGRENNGRWYIYCHLKW